VKRFMARGPRPARSCSQGAFAGCSRSARCGPPVFEPIRILNIVVDEVTAPRNDGTPGSALCCIPFQLSRRPPSDWADAFVQQWNRPPRWTSMHRPGIARVSGDKVYLDGTTIEEVQKYHRDTLVLALEETNRLYGD